MLRIHLPHIPDDGSTPRGFPWPPSRDLATQAAHNSSTSGSESRLAPILIQDSTRQRGHHTASRFLPPNVPCAVADFRHQPSTCSMECPYTSCKLVGWLRVGSLSVKVQEECSPRNITANQAAAPCVSSSCCSTSPSRRGRVTRSSTLRPCRLRLNSSMSSHYCSDVLRLVIGDKLFGIRNKLRHRRFVGFQPVANRFLLHCQLEVISNDDITVRAGDFSALRHLDRD
jgi:hypothetical protein